MTWAKTQTKSSVLLYAHVCVCAHMAAEEMFNPYDRSLDDNRITLRPRYATLISLNGKEKS